MIVSTKIVSMFKHCGFVNIDYLVKNKLERDPSKILNIINRDWRKWVKPVCMKPNPKTLDPLDPNFGYETIGASESSIEGYISGSVFPTTEAGTADSITAALKWLSTAWTGKIKCAIYLHSDLSLVGATEERTIALTNTFVWYTFNFITKPGLTTSTAYVLVIWSQSTTGYNRLAYSAGDTDQGHYQTKTYDSFPDPLVPTHEARKYSIYCTYTTSGPPPAAGILAQVI